MLETVVHQIAVDVVRGIAIATVAEAGLKCFFRSGFEAVPGCTGEGGVNDVSGSDICYSTTSAPTASSTTPLPTVTSLEISALPVPAPTPTPTGFEPGSTTLRYVGDCNLSNRCDRCTGDCDSDKGCKAGLKCFFRSGFEAVPGCTGEGGANDSKGKDMCYSTTSEPTPSPTIAPTIAPTMSPIAGPALLYLGTCNNSTSRCDRCTGGCVNDNDCRKGLKCFFRSGFEAVPGCSDEGGQGDMFGEDMCYSTTSAPTQSPTKQPTSSPTKQPTGAPTKFGSVLRFVKQCDNSNRCDRCTGDCDSDNDCIAGLKCFYRSEFEAVPGCIGEGGVNDAKGRDMCYSTTSEPTQSPTKSPTTSPTTSPTISPMEQPTDTTTRGNCADSAFRLKIIDQNDDKITRNCSWVANKSTNLRCALNGVKESCPLTCKYCSTCVDSPLRFKFSYNNETITRNCKWVGTRSTKMRCQVPGMENICPNTCSNC
jgi:hypothetical protein